MSKSRQSNGRERDELMRDLSAPIETGKRRSRQRPAQVFPADRARAPRQTQQGKGRQEQNRRDPDDSLLDRRQIATEQRAPGKAAAESAPTRSQLFPADYAPRPQFTPFHARTERFACIVTHRRAGKTVACIHDLQRAALSTSTVRPRLAYLSPFLKQSKAVAWDYLRNAMSSWRPSGATTHESELRADYPNGGQVRLYGADNPDALRGIYLDGVVLDEYADMDPRVWSEIIRPAIADRQGWAVFIGTPKGRSSFYELWRRSQSEPGWFALMLKASETGLIPEHELELARRDLTEEQFAQEFECSFEAAIIGAYYGKLMAQAERDKRITGVPYEPSAQVWTAWDLGIRDATAIWFAQVVGREVRIIDCYEASGVDLGHYVRDIVARPYIYGGHIVPHDAQAKELGTGKSRLEVLQSLGLKNITVAPMHRIEDGINAVRMLVPRCWFDATKCARGIDALKLYRAAVDDRMHDPAGRPVLRPQPVHDWTSHAADAFRYLAMTLDRRITVTNFNRRIIEYPPLGIV